MCVISCGAAATGNAATYREAPMKYRFKYRFSLARFVPICLVLLVILAAALSALAQAPTTGKIVQMDRDSFQRQLKALGYKRRGGIDRAKTDSSDQRFRSLTHFSSSFTVGGVTYPYTMLGFPPRSGRQAEFRSVVIPLRMNFFGFGPDPIVFEPGPAVTNIINSPMYRNAQFANGFGQFGEMMQRATFWNKMDSGREWRVRMARPRVMQTVDIEVTPETGSLFKIGSAVFGNVLIDFMDAQAQTIIQLSGLDPDELPVFVTDNVTAEALGYHTAVSVLNPDGTETFQTYLYTSWLDPALVDPIIADVSTFNHENLEWFNDPFVNNVVPTWRYPPESDPRAVCSGNSFLEVGDPEGNGPTFDDFPTVVVPIDGVDYHLQDLVMLPWFADEVPSSAENGWYDFPATTDIKAPAVYCK
jgi:hypothetical protein